MDLQISHSCPLFQLKIDTRKLTVHKTISIGTGGVIFSKDPVDLSDSTMGDSTRVVKATVPGILASAFKIPPEVLIAVIAEIVRKVLAKIMSWEMSPPAKKTRPNASSLYLSSLV
jgi:hypothetical protein